MAGNHGRFLFDFSPESVVFRLTQEPAPRILYAFQSDEAGTVGLSELLRKVRAGDVPANELVLGGAVVEALDSEARAALSGAVLLPGVRAACEAVCARLGKDTR